jgi:hypothetical protein
MGVTRDEALTEVRGPHLPLDTPAAEGSDQTEELADEITSELAPDPAPPASALPAESPTGAIVLRERFLLETQIGSGGTALIYRAMDLRRDTTEGDGRHVAIKLLRPELRDRPHAIARLRREFRLSRLAAHPAVVHMHDLDCDAGTWFVVMELLTGETLARKLRRAAPSGLRIPEALRIAAAVGEALAHAHALGVTHGDVKPGNVFLCSDGELRLLDFGVAADAAGGAGAETVPPAATRAYASPEVLAGADPEPRDDVFSLACVVYEMLAGRHPFARRPAEASEPPVPIAALAPAQLAAIAAGLSLQRGARPSMREFVNGPDDAKPTEPASIAPGPTRAQAAPLPFTPPPAPAAAVAASPRNRLPLLAAMAAVLALLLGILIGRRHEPATALPPPPVVTRAAVAPAVPAAVPAPAGVPAPAPEPPAARSKAAAPLQGIVYFDVPRMLVSRNAAVAAIPVSHLMRARRAVHVEWRIVEGTARRGRDFDGPIRGVESFVEGSRFRILYVPILQDADAHEDRSFTVEMTGASRGLEIGPTPRVEVTIQGDG